MDYFVVTETKLDSSFPCTQFHINGYELEEREKNGGRLNWSGKVLHANNLEPKSSEVIRKHAYRNKHIETAYQLY